MTREHVSGTVEQLIRKLLTDNKDQEINPDHTFTDLGLDSLMLVDLLGSAEIHFDIDVPDEEVGNFVHVRDLTDFVLRAA